MKQKFYLILGGLLLMQAAFCVLDCLNAQVANPDSLSWVREVTSTQSTQTKTCVLEFADSLIVDWGDGKRDSLSKAVSGETLTHNYSVPGDFTCRAFGKVLSYFKADSRRIKAVSLTKAPSLTYLSCSSNQLTELNVQNNRMLLSLYCSGNGIAQLLLDSCKQLQNLTCSDNKLKVLNVSGIPALKKLTCHTNPLTELRVHASGSLGYLSATNCSLSVSALDTLFAHLPRLTEVSTSKNLLVLNNPGIQYANVSIALLRNWTPDATVTTCSLYIPATSFPAGDTVKLNLCLTNPVPIIAFEVNATFPAGFRLDTLRTQLTALRKGAHLLSIASLDAGKNQYKIMAYSMKSSDLIKGSSGVVLELVGTMPDSVQQVVVKLEHAILVDTATNVANVVSSNGDLTILPAFVVGDVNKDNRVNVTDIVNLVAYINGRNPVGFQAVAADVNRDGKYNVVDITKLVVLINREVGSVLSASLNPSKSAVYGVSNDYQSLSVGNHVYVRNALQNTGGIELCLDNAEMVQACQVDVILPKGLRLDNTALVPSGSRLNGHVVHLNRIDSARYRLLIYALKPDAAFESNTGSLVELPLIPQEDQSEETYRVRLENAVLTGMHMTSISSNCHDGSITVPDRAHSEDFLRIWSEKNTLNMSCLEVEELYVTDVSGQILLCESQPISKVRALKVPQGIYIVHARKKNGKRIEQKVLVQ